MVFNKYNYVSDIIARLLEAIRKIYRNKITFYKSYMSYTELTYTEIRE